MNRTSADGRSSRGHGAARPLRSWMVLKRSRADGLVVPFDETNAPWIRQLRPGAFLYFLGSYGS